ncbi:DUF1351 domain-containing protein [Clostridium sp. UBA1056]|uniref:DUF1351 domain-containing protein n=1 Tax=Clostridium sp. UBA1056 TaxID=1946346 RepID=UPI0032162255
MKEGIEIFNDKAGNRKLQCAEKNIAETIKEYGLEEKFARQLNVLDSYTNLTATLKSIKEDIEVKRITGPSNGTGTNFKSYYYCHCRRC